MNDIAQTNQKKLEFIEDVTSNADEVQERVLTEILSTNAEAEYLKRHGLNRRTDRKSFKRILPVVTYEDLQPDIARIANGDKSFILSARPVSEFLTSSGTSSGERKLIPTFEGANKPQIFLHSLIMPVIVQYIPGLEIGKGMQLQFTRTEEKTPGGLIARPMLNGYYKSSYFRDRPYHPYTDYTTPYESITCLDLFQSMYSQMLCGLYQRRDVFRIGALFASGLTRALRFLEKHWTRICNDIRNGTVDPEITDSPVRAAVLRIIRPNPALADEIAAECGKTSWRGIITRLWPNAKYIDTVVTGTMAHYIPSLEYYNDGLPLVSTIYGSSECFFGINLSPLSKPSEVSYTLFPNMAYFEFLPIDRSTAASNLEKEQQELVDLVNVKLGKEYELVVTTYAGLYRYRVGDVLRVSGFKNKAPQFQYVCRTNVVLSVDVDKTDESELHNAVKNTVKHLLPFKATVVDYTSYADMSDLPGHYVLYWELRCDGGRLIPASVFEDCCHTLEQSLSSVYRQCRTDNSIGPLEIKILKSGTFDVLTDYAINCGASLAQYKTPRCVKVEHVVETLNSRVVSSYFSFKCPIWVPGQLEGYW